MRLGPLAFLFGVVGAWTAARTLMLWPGAPAPATRAIAWAQPLKIGYPASANPLVAIKVETRLAKREGGPRPRSKPTEVGTDARRFSDTPMSRAHLQGQERHSGATWLPPAMAANPERRPDRWSLSAWTLVRGEGAPGLAAGGQLAGSQAGFRLRYRLSEGFHLAARVSGPLQIARGKEAALALDWQPIRKLPLTFTIERRVGLDAGGRDAFATGAFGGFDVRPTRHVTIDGYAQAGAVGLKRRDPYVDGSLRIERDVATVSEIRFGIGAGAWGGAQPGAARVDLGPQLVAHIPAANGGLRIGAEWRQRVAGRARPGSGPVLSLGADF